MPLRDERDETFTVTLAGVAGGQPGTPGAHVITILDDDVSAADFTGDGVGDALLYDRASGVMRVKAGLAGGGYGGDAATMFWGTGATIHSGDFDGDGRPDLFVYNPATGGWWRYDASGGGVVLAASGVWAPQLTLVLLDLDGDARTDVFRYAGAGSGEWTKCLTDPTQADGFRYGAAGGWAPGWQIVVARLNGDLRDDMLLYAPSSGVFYRALSLANADTFAYGTGAAWVTGAALHVGDFDGDGLDDVFVYRGGPTSDATQTMRWAGARRARRSEMLPRAVLSAGSVWKGIAWLPPEGESHARPAAAGDGPASRYMRLYTTVLVIEPPGFTVADGKFTHVNTSNPLPGTGSFPGSQSVPLARSPALRCVE
jgi:hypothetical protein